MPFNTDYIKSPSGMLKFAEIVFVVVAFGLFRGSFANFGSEDANYFGGGILVTAMIITPLLLVCYLMGRLEIQKTIFEVTYDALMFVFLLSAGCVAINSWSKAIGNSDVEKKSKAMGSFCLLASGAYLADTVFAVNNFRG